MSMMFSKSIRDWLEKFDRGLISVQQAVLGLYKECLAETRPDWETGDRATEDFQAAILEMEKMLVHELCVVRHHDGRIVRRYLTGAYQMIVCKNDRFGLNHLSPKRRREIARLVQEGKTFKEAYTESGNQKPRDNVEPSHFVLRPTNPGEEVGDYLRYINETVRAFIQKQHIRVLDGFTIRKAKRRA
jgi:hypothetical protein